jgi:predicted RNA-binding Zn-ribbon protein involved in translation (DUF1610 family)
VTCPKCGAEMNRHAQKLVHGGDGDVLDEVWACPRCGASAWRTAPER